MRTDEDLQKGFSVKKEGNIIYMDFLEAPPEEEDNGRQAELVVEQIVKVINKDMSQTYSFLIDLTKVGTIHYMSDKAKKAYMKLANFKILKKAAIIGKGLFIEVTLNLIMQAIGRGDSFKMFDSREEALAWLTEE
jgi:hypothetical protein